MPLYRYKARNKDGEMVSSKREAIAADMVASQLLKSGIVPVDITEVKERKDWLEDLKRRLTTGKPKAEDLIHFCRQMYSLSKASVPIILSMKNPG